MLQFFQGQEEDWAALETRARGRCLRFNDQQMPPETTPSQAAIGFEVLPGTGEALLLVDRGLVYRGEVEDVACWFRSGEKRFRSFANLREWVQETLYPAFGSAEDPAEPEVSNQDCAPFLVDEEQLFQALSRKVRGQKETLRAMSRHVRRHAARRSPSRPAVMFAVGPTGVGKTRSAECLAASLQNSANEVAGYNFLRLDMNEYQEAYRVSQLLGSPQGYVGYGEGSQLIDALRLSARTVVLFDEIEKAHPAIFRALMSAMDSGRLSTPSGGEGQARAIDCRQAIFIFTSNLDAEAILDELKENAGIGCCEIEDEVCRRRLQVAGIPAEIVGRIGRFLVFDSLSPEIRAEIVALGIAETAAEYGLALTHVDPEVVASILQKLKSVGFGVRPERFLIDNVLGDLFADAVNNQWESVALKVPPLECVQDEGGLMVGDTDGEGPECVESQPSVAAVVNSDSQEESGSEG